MYIFKYRHKEIKDEKVGLTKQTQPAYRQQGNTDKKRPIGLDRNHDAADNAVTKQT